MAKYRNQTENAQHWLEISALQSPEVLSYYKNTTPLLLQGRGISATALSLTQQTDPAHDLPRDFMYLFDLRSPILEAFFLTASVGLPNFPAISAVGLLGKSFLSILTSLLAHKPFTVFLLAFFFAIMRPLSRCYRFSPLWDIFSILGSDATIIKLFSGLIRKFLSPYIWAILRNYA